jgi:2-methylcitrate dehydratase PrpD
VIAHPTSCDDAVLRLAERGSLVADPQFSARFPAERLAQVILRLDDGTVLQSEPTSSRGDPDSPLRHTEISSKFHRLAGRLAVERRQRIEDEVSRLDRGGSVPALLDAVLEEI